MTYAEERETKIAQLICSIIDNNPLEEVKKNWNIIADYTPHISSYLILAREIVKWHLSCCEQKCPKCGLQFCHWCSHCDRQ